MNDPTQDPTLRLVEAVEKIRDCLVYICEQGVFVKIDDDVSEN